MDRLEHYWKFSEVEQRFNGIQSGIRTLASAWLLTAGGAVGLLLRTEGDLTWVVPRGVLIVLVCTLAVGGFATLWVMDQLVFQRLLNSVFVVGLKMEADDATLPPIRAMMMLSAERRGMHRWMRLFYLVPMLVLFIVSVLVTVRPIGIDASEDAWLPGLGGVVLSVGLLVAQISAIGWVLMKQGSVDFRERARAFGDPRFDEIVDSGAYDAIIGRHHGRAAESEAAHKQER